MGLGIPEIVIILLAAAILLFGGKKITELARGMGRASGEYKKAKKEVERELKDEEAKAAEGNGSQAPASSTEENKT